MNKITTVSKKTLAVLLAMIMALSCMATAFAIEAVKPAAPEAINVLAAFSDTIVIEEIEGGEYAILAYAEDGSIEADEAEYKNSAVFEGLEAETDYAVYARFAATDTDVASEYVTVDVTTGKADEDPEVEIAEEDITVNDELKNIICAEKIVEYNGQTYVVKYDIAPATGVDVSTLADGGIKFGNLSAGGKYSITAKITVAGVDFATTVEKTLKLAQNSPSAPVPTKVTGTSIEVKAMAKDVLLACAVKGSTDELVWASTNVFKDLAPETTYVIYAKYPATETYLESAPAFIELTTLKASAGTAPQPVLLDKNNTSIKLGAGDDVATEFSIDGGKTWNKSGVFTGLKANTKYDFVARYVFDASKQDASGISESISVITNKRANYEASLNNCVFTIATEDKVYANSSFTFTVKGDTYAEADQYGDTRFIPVAWSYADQGETVFGNVLTITGTADTPATSQDISVKVTYELQKFNGTGWVAVDTATADYSVHVSPEYNAVKAFFEGLLNFLLNFLPNLILGFMK